MRTIRRWIIAAGILGAVTLALLGTVIAIADGWARILAILALLAGLAAALTVARSWRLRGYRSGIDLVMGHVRQMLDDAPDRRTPVG